MSIAEALVRAAVAGDAAALEAILDDEVSLRVWHGDGADACGGRELVLAALAADRFTEPALVIHRRLSEVVEYTVRDGGLEHHACALVEPRDDRIVAIDIYRAAPIAASTPADAIAPASIDDDALDRLLIGQRPDLREAFLVGRERVRRRDVSFSGARRRDPLLNNVNNARFDGADPDARIDEVIAWHRERDRPFTWRVSRFDHPPDLAARLARRGLVHDGVEAVMALRLPGRSPIVVDPAVAIAVLDGDDPGDCDQALAITGRAFEWSAARIAEVRPWWRDRLRAVDVSHERRHYLARLDGEAVGFASLSLCRGLAQLTGAGVVPRARRRGAYTALLARRLADAADRGYQIATISAMPASRDIAAGHGFVERARIDRWVWRPETT